MTKKTRGFQSLFGVGVALSLLLLPSLTRAKDIGADPPPCSTGSSCQKCTPKAPTCGGAFAGVSISYSNGNLSVPSGPVVSTLKSAYGPAINLSLTYNSYNADGSRAQVDTAMGYGWTHSYNIFLFNQLGNMFRMDGTGRVTKYQYQGGGMFSSAPGYFETLTNNMDGTFTIRQKDATTYLFAEVANTLFQVFGPVYRLQKITDRNNNVTTVTYDSSGDLTQVTDTYGRAITFTYNSSHHLEMITDPLGRTTTFTYDSTGHRLTQIDDPNGMVTQYTYNALSQLTKSVDRDGRVFTYSYNSSLEPTGITDGGGHKVFSLANPSNWSTNSTSLAEYQTRVYTPSTTSNTDGLGNVWQYTYDANGYVDTAVAPDSTTTSYTYDPATLQPATITDANGNVTTYMYDSQGNRIERKDALGFVTTYTYEPTFNQMTSMTDPNGRTTIYTIDPATGNLLQTTDPLGNVETWTYDSHGNVLTHTDKDGHTTTYTYDGNGNLATTTDPLGYVTTTSYDADGNLLSRTDPNSHTTSYTYDGLNRVLTVTDPLGNVTTNVYDGEGDLVQVTDRDGHVTQYQYDTRDRLITVTDALGHKSTTTYDTNNNVITTTDQNSHTTRYFYDVRNRMIKVEDALSDTNTTTYDPVGNVLSQTDADGHTTTYTYDALNRQVSSTDAVGSVTTTIYDVTGPNTGPCLNVCTGPTLGSSRPSEIIDGDGNASLHIGTTYYHYDGLDRRIQVVRKQLNNANDEPPDPNDAVTYTTYDAVGNVLAVTEPDGNTTTTVYDADNRRIQMTDAAGDVTTWTYDGVGNVISSTAPTTNVTTTHYDADDRVIQVTDGGGTVVTYTYDAIGNVLSSTDGNGNTTTNAYDAIYRITEVTDPLGLNTTYTYDPTGNLLTSTDRNGNVTTYGYDAINRCITVKDALSHTTKYQYDAVGNQVELTDANGHITTYAYDGVNRLITESYADGHARTYTYDYVGNLTTRTDQNGVTTTYDYSDLYFLTSRVYPSSTDTFTYDLSGRLLSGTRGGWTDTFTYDGADRVLTSGQGGETVDYSYIIPAPTTRTITYPGGRVVTETLDIRSRLEQIDDASSPPPIATYTYDAGDRVLMRNYRNGISATYTYNNDDWLTNVTHSAIAGFTYAYDNEGNKLYEQKLSDTTHSEAYTYDKLYRLITYKVGTLVGSTVPLPSTQITYTLDPVGNWPKKVTVATPGPTTTTENRTHNAVNEITLINGAPLTYDDNGNLTSDTLYTYAYDEENRLTTVTRKSDSRVVGQYEYDALSRRVQKMANPATPPSPTTTYYFYDDARIIEEQNTAFLTQATYVYGNYIDEVLEMDRPVGTPYYFHQNALWSVEAATNSAGTAVEYYRYDAYGLPTVLNGSFTPVADNAWGTPHSAIGNPYLFTGRELDEETGAYYYRARQYDDAKGRFLERDLFEGVEADNLYAYVADRPTFYVDPLGNEPPDPCKLWKKGDARALGSRCSNVHWLVDLEDGKLPEKEDLKDGGKTACGEVYQCKDALEKATCNMTSSAVTKLALNFLSNNEKTHADFDKDKNAWVTNECCCNCAAAENAAPGAAPAAPMPDGANPGGGGNGGGDKGGGQNGGGKQGGGNPGGGNGGGKQGGNGGGKPPQKPPQGGVAPKKPAPKPPIKPKAPTPVLPHPKKK
jgi:RHS repeat-associated protein